MNALEWFLNGQGLAISLSSLFSRPAKRVKTTLCPTVYSYKYRIIARSKPYSVGRNINYKRFSLVLLAANHETLGNVPPRTLLFV